MNEGGYSWPEALLTLTIIIVIFGSLLPLVTMMTSQLSMRKTNMYAAETAFQGAVTFNAYGLMEGVRRFEEVEYHWYIEGQSVCVFYKVVEKEIDKCVG